MRIYFWKSHSSDPDRPNHLVNSVFPCICMNLGPHPGSVLRSWSSKPPGLQCLCMYVHAFRAKPKVQFWDPDPPQTSWFTVNLHGLVTKPKLILPKGEHLALPACISIILSVPVFWGQIQFWKSHFSDPDPTNYRVYSVFAWFWD